MVLVKEFQIVLKSLDFPPNPRNHSIVVVLCHNVVVVIHELQESSIDPGFLADDLDTASELVC